MPRSSGFATIIKRARFNVPGYSPQAMIGFGKTLLGSIQQRMDRAQDVYDTASPPLSAKYQLWKGRKYGSAVRDLKATGRTRRGMNVLEAGQNYCVLGFTDPVALSRTRLNNRLSRQWGVSQVNSQQLAKAVQESPERPVVAVQERVNTGNG